MDTQNGRLMLFSLPLFPLLGQGPAARPDGQSRGQIRLQVSDPTGATLKLADALSTREE
jgi:hypothetical protein